MAAAPTSESRVNRAAKQRDCGSAVGCTLRFDRKRRILLLTFEKAASQTSVLATYSVVKRFIDIEGPCSVIADLSTIEKVDITGNFVRSIAWMPLLVPSGKQSVIVAPRAEVYGLGRMFQLYREAKSSNVKVVHSFKEAETLLGLESSDFEPVDLNGRMCRTS
jgi:hypothetical protein